MWSGLVYFILYGEGGVNGIAVAMKQIKQRHSTGKLRQGISRSKEGASGRASGTTYRTSEGQPTKNGNGN